MPGTLRHTYDLNFKLKIVAEAEGVPIPIIVRLFDDALQVCEEVCQQTSFDITEALQSHQDSSPPAKDSNGVKENSKSISKGISCHPDAELDILKKTDLVDAVVADDISWYFDGQNQEVDDSTPWGGFDIPGAHGDIPGVPEYIAATEGHIPGTDKMKTPTTKLPEVNTSRNINYLDLKISRNGDVTTGNENLDKISLHPETCKSQGGILGAKANVRNMSPPRVNMGKPEESGDSQFYPKIEGEISCGKKTLRTPLESIESWDESLSSRMEDRCVDEDEFETCLPEAVSNTANGNIATKPPVLNEHNEDLRSPRFFGENFTNAYTDTNYTKFQNAGAKSFETLNKINLSSLPLISSDGKDKKVDDNFLRSLSEKLESKKAGVQRRVKLSEIFKGSRHFVNSSSNGASPHLADVADRPNRQLKKLSTDVTLSRSIPKTGQAGKTSSVDSTSHNRQTLSVQDKVSSFSAQVNSTERNKRSLFELGSHLSHGKDLEMKLAVEVTNSLFFSSIKTSLKDFEIPLRMIHTELVLGPSSSFSCRIDGLLLENTSTFQFSSSNQNLPTCKLLLALIDGDVTPEFRHVGLNNELQIHRIVRNEYSKSSDFSQEKEWYQGGIASLSKHKIGILVVKGIIHDSMLDYCSSHNITVLQNVSYPVLQLLSFATDSAIITYLADLRKQDLGRPVTIETWELGWAPCLVRQSKLKGSGARDVRVMKTCQYVLVREVFEASSGCKDFNSPLQTVLLCSPCKDVLCDMEERFWNSIYRLKNALSCGRVLPGAGEIEAACIRRLTVENDTAPSFSFNPLSGWLQESIEVFRPLVYTAFAQGLKDFLCSVLLNSGNFTSHSGASSYVEKLVNEGLTLDDLERFQDDHSDDHRGQPLRAEGIKGGHAMDRVPPRDPAGFSTDHFRDLFDSKQETRKVKSHVWDNYTAKKEAWRRAVGVVRILLQSDMFVETGLRQSKSEIALF
ncbi:Bardet-Biedl syndrome 12 protein [Stylophora pistillata]|uniref:Bardet-Biedl syndrome 12 protein n=1 Tax=Stylophora pistillata TaxID=50429 RepID=A0A2B4SPJ6_STYPI|nr:Bardet-Biedl syndrome 12 protein [Stylophora pistillata]